MKTTGRKKLNIALSGDRGRMGKSLKKLIKKDSKKQATAVANTKVTHKKWDHKKIDVVIDFSLPPMFLKTLKWCLDNNKALVSGTTGLSASQKQLLKKASKKIPIFYAENMSWGIFCLTKWLDGLSGEIKSILIEDIHHKHKKDKPSGTALRLKNYLPKQMQKKVRIKSKRQGNELGIHRVFLKTDKEQIVLEHKSLSRDLFSEGAIKASEFIVKRKRGLYSVQDLWE